ncbi:F-box DNA helicase 1-like [Sycon ciliatum]|uniref:F-box DNA helicase 1-like n=1 Tax=Sycon ciliatum TaxID=27933 RepID=UPI0031F7077B
MDSTDPCKPSKVKNEETEDGSPAKRRCSRDSTLHASAATGGICASQCRHIKELPRSVLKQIFGYLSLDDLQACKATCHSWHSIAADTNYRKYMKMYFSYWQRDPAVCEAVNQYLGSSYELSPCDCLFFLIRAVEDVVRPGYCPDRATLELLSSFPAAEEYVKALFPQPRSTWPLVTAMTYFANGVDEIIQIIEASNANCPFNDFIIDLFFAIALILLALERTIRISPYYHYKVYYALCNISKVPGDTAGKTLTSEQLRILQTRPVRGDVIKITAFAGTGKTYTLEQMIRKWASPSYYILYVSFNKSIQEEAAKNFNTFVDVQCRTMHSLVHARYPFDLELKDLHYRLGAIRDLLGLDARGAAKIVVQTVKSFMASADTEISRRHLPGTRMYLPDNRQRRSIDEVLEAARRALPEEVFDNWIREHEPLEEQLCYLKEDDAVKHAKLLWDIVSDAKRFYKELEDPDESDRPHLQSPKKPHLQSPKKPSDRKLLQSPKKPRTKLITAVALKVCQLEQLKQPDLFDGQCILVDEAQDFTDCDISMLLQQKSNCGLVFVGDPNQSIYRFNHVRPETFPSISATKSFSLTESFRFGPNIAFLSSLLLRLNKGNGGSFLTGLLPSQAQDSLCGTVRPPPEKVYVLAKENLTLIDYALNVFLNDSDSEPPLRVYINMQNIWSKLRRLQVLHSIYANMMNLNSPNQQKSKKQYFQLRNMEMKGSGCMVKSFSIVEKYHCKDLSKMLEVAMWKEKVHTNEETADVVLSTVHMAKGRTLDHVILAKDIFGAAELDVEQYFAGHRSSSGIEVEQVNVAYVACSRARHSLLLSKGLVHFFERFDRRCTLTVAGDLDFFYPEESGNTIAMEDNVFPVCEEHASSESAKICVLGHRYPHSVIASNPRCYERQECGITPHEPADCLFCRPAKVFGVGCLRPLGIIPPQVSLTQISVDYDASFDETSILPCSCSSGSTFPNILTLRRGDVSSFDGSFSPPELTSLATL